MFAHVVALTRDVAGFNVPGDLASNQVEGRSRYSVRTEPELAHSLIAAITVNTGFSCSSELKTTSAQTRNAMCCPCECTVPSLSRRPAGPVLLEVIGSCGARRLNKLFPLPWLRR